jgi:hypothetical protein
MIAPQDTPTPSPRNGAGNVALALGVAAIMFIFVPIVGEFIAIPAAIGAVVTGFIGFDRVDQGRATNRRDAVVGGTLGALALLIMLVMFAAVHGADAEAHHEWGELEGPGSKETYISSPEWL